jgi:hypothetical protein
MTIGFGRVQKTPKNLGNLVKQNGGQEILLSEPLIGSEIDSINTININADHSSLNYLTYPIDPDLIECQVSDLCL